MLHINLCSKRVCGTFHQIFLNCQGWKTFQTAPRVGISAQRITIPMRLLYFSIKRLDYFHARPHLRVSSLHVNALIVSVGSPNYAPSCIKQSLNRRRVLEGSRLCSVSTTSGESPGYNSSHGLLSVGFRCDMEPLYPRQTRATRPPASPRHSGRISSRKPHSKTHCFYCSKTIP